MRSTMRCSSTASRPECPASAFHLFRKRAGRPANRVSPGLSRPDQSVGHRPARGGHAAFIGAVYDRVIADANDA